MMMIGGVVLGTGKSGKAITERIGMKTLCVLGFTKLKDDRVRKGEKGEKTRGKERRVSRGDSLG
jgi:hypothetical protein